MKKQRIRGDWTIVNKPHINSFNLVATLDKAAAGIFFAKTGPKSKELGKYFGSAPMVEIKSMKPIGCEGCRNPGHTYEDCPFVSLKMLYDLQRREVKDKKRPECA
jgi:hypothetical protein